jgi:signal transduction histidine kinase
LLEAQMPDTPDAAPPRSMRALDAQAELLPYAIGFFAIALPIFVWAGAYAEDAVFMSAIFVQFSLNWAGFYAVVNRLGRKAKAPLELATRTRLHVAGGLLWALATAEIAVFAMNAGAVRPVLLAMDVAAAVACCFFAAPSLTSLMIVAPAAAAGPLTGFFLSGDRSAIGAASGALAMAMALCLVLNRILRRQFALAAEREALMAQHAASLAMAERLAVSKSQILATLSQEIRNGLTGVTHVLAAAVGGGRAAPSREQLSAALGAASDLLEALNATLDSESASAGKLALERRPFDPAALARSIALQWRPRASAKTLELSVHVDEGLGPAGAAVGDPARVRQILSSLLGNAIKYTSRGRIEARVLPVGRDRVRFEVVDTGPGLTPEELERAFEPFSRVERVGLGLPGAGLGLSLSRELARLMGGEVSAESAVGVGSRFWFDIPYDPAARPEEDLAADASQLAAGAAAPARGLRVLLSEPDALSAAMLRAAIEQLGHQVVHTNDGARAAELAGLCQFDLVLADGQTPPPAGDAPVIALIGEEVLDGEAGLSTGFDQVLRKPATVATLARAIAAALERRPARAPTKPPARARA